MEFAAPVCGRDGRGRGRVPFCALTEYEVRAADVAFVSQSRWDWTAEDDYLRGSPELIVEVLSRSANTTGRNAREGGVVSGDGMSGIWVVDPGRRGVSITRRDGENLGQRRGCVCSSAMLGAEIAVGRIFD